MKSWCFMVLHRCRDCTSCSKHWSATLKPFCIPCVCEAMHMHYAILAICSKCMSCHYSMDTILTRKSSAKGIWGKETRMVVYKWKRLFKVRCKLKRHTKCRSKPYQQINFCMNMFILVALWILLIKSRCPFESHNICLDKTVYLDVLIISITFWS